MAIIDGNISGVTPNSKSGSDIYNQDKGDLQKLRDSILESFKTQQATFLEISKNVKIVSDYIQLHPEFIDYTKLSESIKNAIGEPIIQEKTQSYGEIPDYNGILNDIYSAIIKTDKPENVNIRPESKEKTEKEGIEEEKKNPHNRRETTEPMTKDDIVQGVNSGNVSLEVSTGNGIHPYQATYDLVLRKTRCVRFVILVIGIITGCLAMFQILNE